MSSPPRWMTSLSTSAPGPAAEPEATPVPEAASRLKATTVAAPIAATPVERRPAPAPVAVAQAPLTRSKQVPAHRDVKPKPERRPFQWPTLPRIRLPQLPKVSVTPSHIKRGALGLGVVMFLGVSIWGARIYMNRPAPKATPVVVQTAAPMKPAIGASHIQAPVVQPAPVVAPVVAPLAVTPPPPAPAVATPIVLTPPVKMVPAGPSVVVAPPTEPRIPLAVRKTSVTQVVRHPSKVVDPSLKAYGKEANSALDAFEARLKKH